MASLVRDFQRDIVQSSKGTTELLRTAKLIAAKLNLPEISEWVGRELTGYPSDGSRIPPYRIIAGGMLMALNPVRGWQSAGHVNRQFPIIQSMPELEKLASEKSIVMPLTGENRYRLDGIANNFSQQVELSTVQLTGIISAVREDRKSVV